MLFDMDFELWPFRYLFHDPSKPLRVDCPQPQAQSGGLGLLRLKIFIMLILLWLAITLNRCIVPIPGCLREMAKFNHSQ
jgi:hypothetical protein